MISFLRQVAEWYYPQDSLVRTVFVLPNRRSLAFLRKHFCSLAAADSKAMLSPRLTTIGDFFSTMSGVAPSDRISLLVELYEVYKKLFPKAEPLDDFIYWGDVLLSDFDDVDKYRVDAGMLFRNIADLRAIKDTFEYADNKQKEAIDKLVKNFDTVTWVSAGNVVARTGGIEGGYTEFDLHSADLLDDIYMYLRFYITGKDGICYSQPFTVYRDGETFEPVFVPQTRDLPAFLRALVTVLDWLIFKWSPVVWAFKYFAMGYDPIEQTIDSIKSLFG